MKAGIAGLIATAALAGCGMGGDVAKQAQLDIAPELVPSAEVFFAAIAPPAADEAGSARHVLDVRGAQVEVLAANGTLTASLVQLPATGTVDTLTLEMGLADGVTIGRVNEASDYVSVVESPTSAAPTVHVHGAGAKTLEAGELFSVPLSGRAAARVSLFMRDASLHQGDRFVISP